MATNHTEYMREWRAKPENQQRIKDCKAASYRRHREETLARQRAYYAAHPEQKVEYQRRLRAADPEAYRARQREASRKRKAKNPVGVRATQRRWHLKERYGMTADEYRRDLVGQAGRCLICGRVPAKNLVVDHDHRTGRYRGLLCSPCNTLLGIVEDDPRRLRVAAEYLDRSRLLG